MVMGPESSMIRKLLCIEEETRHSHGTGSLVFEAPMVRIKHDESKKTFGPREDRAHSEGVQMSTKISRS